MAERLAFDDTVTQYDFPLLVVLSGPSGVGKDAVLSAMREQSHPLHYTVTMTTRPQRPKERDGIDYHFATQETFQSMLEKGEFLEWANVYGNFYGVPRSQIREALQAGRDVVIKADVQGAKTIKEVVPEVVSIFLAPPSLGELADRLVQRKTETLKDLTLRLETARQEMLCLPKFDYVVVNASDRLDEAASRILSIIEAEKCRVVRRRLSL